MYAFQVWSNVYLQKDILSKGWNVLCKGNFVNPLKRKFKPKESDSDIILDPFTTSYGGSAIDYHTHTFFWNGPEIKYSWKKYNEIYKKQSQPFLQRYDKWKEFDENQICGNAFMVGLYVTNDATKENKFVGATKTERKNPQGGLVGFISFNALVRLSKDLDLEHKRPRFGYHVMFVSIRPDFRGKNLSGLLIREGIKKWLQYLGESFRPLVGDKPLTGDSDGEDGEQDAVDDSVILHIPNSTGLILGYKLEHIIKDAVPLVKTKGIYKDGDISAPISYLHAVLPVVLSDKPVDKAPTEATKDSSSAIIYAVGC